MTIYFHWVEARKKFEGLYFWTALPFCLWSQDKSSLGLYMYFFTAISCSVLLRLRSHSPGSIFCLRLIALLKSVFDVFLWLTISWLSLTLFDLTPLSITTMRQKTFNMMYVVHIPSLWFFRTWILLAEIFVWFTHSKSVFSNFCILMPS